MTGLKDKNGNAINVGDTVRFKFYGQHYFEHVVKIEKNGFSPFADLAIEVGIGGVDPNKCEIIKTD